MARIVVIGPGSIGGYFAVEAARNDHEVVLCARRPFDRLSVTQTDGSVRSIDHRALTDSADAVVGDWVLLATKAHHTEGAADWLRASCGPQTRGVVVMQNGVEHHERVAPYVGDTPVIPAIVLCGAEAVAPGEVIHHGYSNLEVPAGDDARDLALLFAGTDANIVAIDDFLTAAWRKLVSNVTASPLTAITSQRLGVMRRPAIRDLAVGLAAECLTVGAATGADLDPDDAAEMMDAMAHTNPQMGSSMLYDRLAGRPTEHDSLTGAVIRNGRRLGIPTPLNQAIFAVLDAIDAANLTTVS